jgi:hypothetical protein
MVLRSKVFKVALATVFGLVIGVGTQTESEATGYQYLCMAKPGLCAYAPATAPQLNANVCMSTTNGSVVLKGTSSCAADAYPFYVDRGELIDPQTGEVQAYIALTDACTMGFCVANNPNDPPGEEGAMCCDPGNGACSETDSICPPDKIAVWCDDGEEAVNQNGQWICEESN